MINLNKGQDYDLSTGVPDLTQVRVGLGWNTASAGARSGRGERDSSVPPGSGAGTSDTFDFDLEWSGPKSDTEGRGAVFDLDVSLFMLGAHGKLPADEFFLFYNNLCSPDGAVVHEGDNRTGAGEGDEEVINLGLAQIPERYARIVFGVSIYKGPSRNQHFGQVANAFVRAVDGDGKEMARYDLSSGGEYEGKISMLMGELVRSGTDWDFRALGEALDEDSIDRVAGRYR
jgi:tellurium resistance protein TerD